jgi:hypothetical protein
MKAAQSTGDEALRWVFGSAVVLTAIAVLIASLLS